MQLADALSRLPSPTNPTTEMDMHIYHHSFMTECLQKIKRETASDPILAPIYDYILNRWPETCQRVPCIARHYWDQRDELGIDNGLLLNSTRIVIHTSQRETTLGNLHTGHFGIQVMQQFARTTVYWPGIDAA